MQLSWVCKGNNPACILFMNGWGMDPLPFTPLTSLRHDLLMVDDYRVLEPLPLQELQGYEQLHLVAWSMGVWMAAHILQHQTALFTSSTAIGGTLTPIDDKRGIPRESYTSIIDNFTPEALDGFYHSMFDDDSNIHQFMGNRPHRSSVALHKELICFKQQVEHYGPGKDIYSHKIITGRDRVFPARNQLRAWGKKNSTLTNWPHFPFYQFADWSEIVATP